MRRIVAFSLVLILSLSLTVSASAPGFDFSGLSVEQLYAVKDDLVTALAEVTRRELGTSPSRSAPCTYVVNAKTKKYHYPSCYSAIGIGEDRLFEFASASDLEDRGYKPCGQCNPG